MTMSTLPAFEFVEDLFLFLLGAETAEHFDPHGKGGEAAAESFVVLKREDGRRRENGDLLANRR